MSISAPLPELQPVSFESLSDALAPWRDHPLQVLVFHGPPAVKGKWLGELVALVRGHIVSVADEYRGAVPPGIFLREAGAVYVHPPIEYAVAPNTGELYIAHELGRLIIAEQPR